MSHVDDGELTAYADGAYRADDPVALRIAAHLSTCGNCRTRLEQNHELRDRAAEILAFATPAMVAAPSFETLQAQAATPTRAPRRAIPLAWAATVVLALGIGWFGRDALRREATRAEMMARPDVPAATMEASDEAPPLAAPAPTEAPTVGQKQTARVSERARDMTANRAEEGKATGAVADAATPTPQVAAPAAAPPPPAAAAASELAQRRELAEIAVTGVATEYISAAEAERRGMQVPLIPQLPVARIGLQGTTTIVEQVLPDETVVTLTVTAAPAVLERALKTQEASAGAARATAAAAAPQRAPNDVVVKVGSKLVTVTGDLLPDSLRALGRKIR